MFYRQKGVVHIYLILIGLVVVSLAAILSLKSNMVHKSSQVNETSPTAQSLVSPATTPSPSLPTIKSKPFPAATPTPFGLNDPVSTEGHCYPREKPYAEPSRDWFVPPKGSAPLFVTLAPITRAGFDYRYGISVGTQWDYDGNGTWDEYILNSEVSGLHHHTYTKNGNFIPKYRSRSNKGTWTPICSYDYEIVVGDSQDYSNDTISVDKINVSATMSKSGPLNASGFIVSTKQNGSAIRFAENNSGGIDEWTGADMNAGMSFEFHLVADKNKRNGIYTRETTLRYTTENGTVWNDGPTITYTITLTD